jgi:ribonuclease-3
VLTRPETAGNEAAGERAGLAARLGWKVGNQELLARALAHRSWCAEHSGREPNERLELLGDAVLGLVVADHLYRTYPEFPEGELAKARAAVVNSVALAAVARELQLGKALFLGKGEESSGGRQKSSILADALEAVIGAIYLDAGYDVVNEIVLGLLGERVREAAGGPGDEDYKSRLQVLCSQIYDDFPIYRDTDSGPDHAKFFHAEVVVKGRSLGRGAGRSKKQAEQVAARYALFTLNAEAGEAGPGLAGSPDQAPLGEVSGPAPS